MNKVAAPYIAPRWGARIPPPLAGAPGVQRGGSVTFSDLGLSKKIFPGISGEKLSHKIERTPHIIPKPQKKFPGKFTPQAVSL